MRLDVCVCVHQQFYRYMSERVTFYCDSIKRSINTIMVWDFISRRTTHVRNPTVGWDQNVQQIASGGPRI